VTEPLIVGWQLATPWRPSLDDHVLAYPWMLLRSWHRNKVTYAGARSVSPVRGSRGHSIWPGRTCSWWSPAGQD